MLMVAADVATASARPKMPAEGNPHVELTPEEKRMKKEASIRGE